jgi:hypothetical protein
MISQSNSHQYLLSQDKRIHKAIFFLKNKDAIGF